MLLAYKVPILFVFLTTVSMPEEVGPFLLLHSLYVLQLGFVYYVYVLWNLFLQRQDMNLIKPH